MHLTQVFVRQLINVFAGTNSSTIFVGGWTRYLRSRTPQSDYWVYTTCGQQAVRRMGLQTVHYGIVATENAHNVRGVTIPDEKGSIIRACDDVLALTEETVHHNYWFFIHLIMLYQIISYAELIERIIIKDELRMCEWESLQHITMEEDNAKLFTVQFQLNIKLGV